MWMDGSGSAAGWPAADNRLAFNNNWQALRQAFFTRGAISGSIQGQLQRNWYLTQGTNKLVTSTAMAEIAGSMDLAMNGRFGAAFTVDLLLADPYFYGAQRIQVDHHFRGHDFLPRRGGGGGGLRQRGQLLHGGLQCRHHGHQRHRRGRLHDCVRPVVPGHRGCAERHCGGQRWASTRSPSSPIPAGGCGWDWSPGTTRSPTPGARPRSPGTIVTCDLAAADWPPGRESPEDRGGRG